MVVLHIAHRGFIITKNRTIKQGYDVMIRCVTAFNHICSQMKSDECDEYPQKYNVIHDAN